MAAVEEACPGVRNGGRRALGEARRDGAVLPEEGRRPPEHRHRIAPAHQPGETPAAGEPVERPLESGDGPRGGRARPLDQGLYAAVPDTEREEGGGEIADHRQAEQAEEPRRVELGEDRGDISTSRATRSAWAAA